MNGEESSTLDNVFGAVGRFGQGLLNTAGAAIDANVRARYTRSPDASMQDAGAQAIPIPAAASRQPTTPGTGPVAGLAGSLAAYAPMALVVALAVLVAGFALKKIG